jgi:peptidoglycan hydrolase-like protein with peptidoglycan-binding domain
MRALRVVLLTMAVVVLLGAAGFGAVLVVHPDGEQSAATQSPGPVPTEVGDDGQAPTQEPTQDPTEQSESPTPAPEPPFRIGPGDHGVQVRELQSRLFQLAWFPELTTGAYGPTTREAVSGFQAKRGLEATGVVDERTWHRLLAMTREPTHDQLFNVLHPGPAILGSGDEGEQVRDLQARLVEIAWLFGDVSGTYDDTTVAAVKGFQAKREIPVTGVVDQRTLDRLHAMTSTPTHAAMYNLGNQPGALDARCKVGRVLCIDKTSQTLRWVVDGQVLQTMDVRFGASYSPTREGEFHVYTKDIDHVSRLYGSSMPFSMFFSGGQAVHYSSDFAAVGYAGASHGCVNVRDYDGLAHLYDQVQVGDKVIVYWS